MAKVVYLCDGQAQEPRFVAELYMRDDYGSGFTISLVRKLTKRQQKMWKKWFGLDYKELEHECKSSRIENK